MSRKARHAGHKKDSEGMAKLKVNEENSPVLVPATPGEMPSTVWFERKNLSQAKVQPS